MLNLSIKMHRCNVERCLWHSHLQCNLCDDIKVCDALLFLLRVRVVHYPHCTTLLLRVRVVHYSIHTTLLLRVHEVHYSHYVASQSVWGTLFTLRCFSECVRYTIHTTLLLRVREVHYSHYIASQSVWGTLFKLHYIALVFNMLSTTLHV